MADKLTQEEMKNKFIDVKPLPPSKFETDYNKGMFNPQELLEKED